MKAEYGLSQRWLAELLGVSEMTVSNWMTGKTTPELRYLFALDALAGIPVIAWLDDDDRKRIVDAQMEAHRLALQPPPEELDECEETDNDPRQLALGIS